jgi:SAM-dependent methyltransferase
VLDLGAGRGLHYALALARTTGAQVTVADIEILPADLERARDAGIRTIQADGCHLPLQDSSFDRILLSSTLQMVPSASELLAECRRLLRPGGFLVVSVPNHYQFIPRILRSRFGRGLAKVAGVPSTVEALTRHLNSRFHVNGPSGYYSKVELSELLAKNGFDCTRHLNSPGWFAMILWEFAILAYPRIGNWSFRLLLPFCPVVRLLDAIVPNSGMGEHIVRAQIQRSPERDSPHAEGKTL